MCIICVDMQKGSLTILEARRNFAEMEGTMDEEHRNELREKLMPKLEAEDYEIESYWDSWGWTTNDYTGGSD